MLKKIINHAIVDLTITPIDPLLIKSGQATVSGVDMSFVQTYHLGEKSEPFIPGSSLKGVIRSYAEKICRSLRVTPVPVCLPYLQLGKEVQGEEGQASCSDRMRAILKNKTDRKGNNGKDDKIHIPSADAYRISCPACRLFGSLNFMGRLSTSDGYITEAFKKNGRPLLETRDGVAIDRLTGGPVKGALYNLEVLTKGEFGTRLEIQNFERWQLGLLGLVLRDLGDGLIRIGMGKSRGLGRIEARVDKFEVAYFDNQQENLVGLAASCSDQEFKDYGFFKEKDLSWRLPLPQNHGLRYLYDLTDKWKEAMEPAVDDLKDYIEGVPWPELIDGYQGRSR